MKLKLKLITALLFTCFLLGGCASSKYGCPSGDEKKLHKFDNRKFNK